MVRSVLGGSLGQLGDCEQRSTGMLHSHMRNQNQRRKKSGRKKREEKRKESNISLGLSGSSNPYYHDSVPWRMYVTFDASLSSSSSSSSPLSSLFIFFFSF